MNCEETKELLVAYVEGLLEDSEKQAVAEHLKDCSACQAEFFIPTYSGLFFQVDFFRPILPD